MDSVGSGAGGKIPVLVSQGSIIIQIPVAAVGTKLIQGLVEGLYVVAGEIGAVGGFIRAYRREGHDVYVSGRLESADLGEYLAVGLGKAVDGRADLVYAKQNVYLAVLLCAESAHNSARTAVLVGQLLGGNVINAQSRAGQPVAGAHSAVEVEPVHKGVADEDGVREKVVVGFFHLRDVGLAVVGQGRGCRRRSFRRSGGGCRQGRRGDRRIFRAGK